MKKHQFNLRTVNVTRYITPLREGGSLPALADADDGFKYVLKFKGAGHGVKALIAELLGGEIARYLQLDVPEIVFAHLDEAFGRTEADEEIQDLLQFSQGLNLALHFLSGSLTYDPATTEVEELLASKIVWLDAFITNVDRTFRNTNLLFWHRELWLIDHGAAFYFHHAFTNWEKSAITPFALIKDHVLLPKASQLDLVDKQFKEILNPTVLKSIVDLIPEEWLEWEGSEWNPEQIRGIYLSFLTTRLAHSELFINEAKKARHALV
ncbi:HipA family kinase [Flavobacterium sp. NKUCC04_CG]|uniref:HipA family kinase n=1 Tax=Flavobacterium sp. NKUCC04_CG TaxID=2842121 RepID=UPI001C5A7AAA|nr:HipA family kinase [Flavobacterium sp. NKUCC04_CG]MBW3518665.1 aminotransferase class I and II [Flavobacterium sp. NKUCC04_CG]